MNVQERAEAFLKAFEKLLNPTICPSLERVDVDLVVVNYNQVNPRFCPERFVGKADIKKLVVSFFADSNFDGFCIERNPFEQGGFTLIIGKRENTANLIKFNKEKK